MSERRARVLVADDEASIRFVLREALEEEGHEVREVDNGDLATAAEILRRDVPATPLYVMQEFAAIDSRFCGEVMPSITSWLWLADLRPCAPGEVP